MNGGAMATRAGGTLYGPHKRASVAYVGYTVCHKHWSDGTEEPLFQLNLMSALGHKRT